MILGCEGLADYHCGLHSLEVPVSSGTRLHHCACTFSSHFGSELKPKDWCEVESLPSGTTGNLSEDFRVTSPDDKEVVSSESSDLCLDTEGIALYIDLPCSPCKDTTEFSNSRNHHEFLSRGPKGSGQRDGISAPVLPVVGSHEQLKMTSQAEVSQRSETNIPSNLGSHVLRTMLDTDNLHRLKRWRPVTPIDENPGSVSHMQEKPEALSSSKMSSPPVVEGLGEHALVRGETLGLAEVDLSKNADNQLRTSSQGDLPCSNLEKMETKVLLNLGTHALRALLEADDVQKLKRRRLTTPADVPAVKDLKENSDKSFPDLDMAIVKDLKENSEKSFPDTDMAIVKDLKENSETSFPDLDMAIVKDLKENSEKSFPDTDMAIVKDLEENSEKSFPDPDIAIVKDLKENSGKSFPDQDIAIVKDLKENAEDSFPDPVSRLSPGLSVSRESDSLQLSLVSPDSGGLPVPTSAPQVENASSPSALDPHGPGDYNSEKTTSGGIKCKPDINSDSSSGSPSHSLGRGNMEKCISRPPRYSSGSTDFHVPRKKEWLGQHHGGKVDNGIVQDTGFAGNVGGCYRSAIDKRPAAPHPGFVGDGATVQFCKVCGENEDATSSLICDSCEEVFHMTCVNARMKIIPRVDEWLCRPCKKKRKMSKEGEHQGEPDAGGEPKDWWREDSGIGRVERELVRMSNGKRMKVRFGPKYQADVPDWTGTADGVDLDVTLAEASDRFGQEVALTDEEKRFEQEQAEYNLANNKWPRGWLPATQLPPGAKESWLQCMLVLYDEGDIFPDGQKAEKDIICGKWRRAPVDIVTDDQWECSCALEWDPRHADCAVPQELSTEAIIERMKLAKITSQQESAPVQPVFQ